MASAHIEPKDVQTYSTMFKNPEHLETQTCTITSKKDESQPMRVVEFHGKMDMKVKIRPKPLITNPVSKTLIVPLGMWVACGLRIRRYDCVVWSKEQLHFMYSHKIHSGSNIRFNCGQGILQWVT